MNRWSIGKRKALMGCRGDLVRSCWSVDLELACCFWEIDCRARRGTSDTAGVAQQINVSTWAVRNALKCRRLRADVRLVGDEMRTAAVLGPSQMLESVPSERQ